MVLSVGGEQQKISKQYASFRLSNSANFVKCLNKMEYYQTDVYENVRFSTFIPNTGHLKYEGMNIILVFFENV